MIVVDTNVIAYLLLRGERTEQARQAFLKDSEWAAPLLWRSEFCSVLGLYLRRGDMTCDQAHQFMISAEALMRGTEYRVESRRVLDLLSRSKCSAHDCEFVALAEELNVPLVTSDKQIVGEFGAVAVSLDAYVS